MTNVWRHIPTQTMWEYIGEDRSAHSAFAVMKNTVDSNLVARIDPLDLFKKNGHWEKLD